jgi:hypothetical protein
MRKTKVRNSTDESGIEWFALLSYIPAILLPGRVLGSIRVGVEAKDDSGETPPLAFPPLSLTSFARTSSRWRHHAQRSLPNFKRSKTIFSLRRMKMTKISLWKTEKETMEVQIRAIVSERMVQLLREPK